MDGQLFLSGAALLAIEEGKKIQSRARAFFKRGLYQLVS